MNKKLIESIKLVPKFSHQHGGEYIVLENGDKKNIFKISEYETNLNFIDKNMDSIWTRNGKDTITYTYDCSNNNKRATKNNYYRCLFNELKVINKLLNQCPDFVEQIEKNRTRYFFDFKF